MEALFESALLFSLAVLIILIGLLVYYFKGRVVDLEQKNAKCLEIINDVYGSHCLLKQTVTAMLMEAADEASNYEAFNNEAFINETSNNEASAYEASTYEKSAYEKSTYEKSTVGGYINVEIEDDHEVDDSSRVSYTDDEEDEQLKTVHVDFNAPEHYVLDTLDVEEIEVDNLSDTEDDNNDLNSVVFNNTQEPEIQVIKTEATADLPAETIVAPVAAGDYKKMSAVALRGYIISSGIQTDAAKLRRMTKQELIDLVTNSALE
jgi:hypothetical protein